MSVVFMTGSHPRHLYAAKQLYDEGLLKGLVIETREGLIPEPHPKLMGVDRINFVRHFQDREIAERKAFGELNADVNFKNVPVLKVTQTTLNDIETGRWINGLNPVAVISYGIHKIEQHNLELFPEHAWNIHGGLSPWYRGNTTLFWPFYFLKPNWAGMTIHKLTGKLDGGDIIHHSVPELRKGDGLHDVACRAVIQAASDVCKIVKLLLEGTEIKAYKQKTSGKLFTSGDWRPVHLRVVYNLFDNDIVDRYLEGELGSDEPPLIRAF